MDKARRKELLRQYKANERGQARRTLGFGEADLKSLLDTLEDASELGQTCGNSPRLTRA